MNRIIILSAFLALFFAQVNSNEIPPEENIYDEPEVLEERLKGIIKHLLTDAHKINATIPLHFNEQKDIVDAEKNRAIAEITTKFHDSSVAKSNDFCLRNSTQKILNICEEVQAKLSDSFSLYSKITTKILRRLRRYRNNLEMYSRRHGIPTGSAWKGYLDEHEFEMKNRVTEFASHFDEKIENLMKTFNNTIHDAEDSFEKCIDEHMD